MSKKIITFAIVVGLSLIAYSLTLEPYRNQKEYDFRYSQMRAGQSEAFYQLREKMVTPKNRLFDSGMTLLLLSTLFGAFRKLGKGSIMSPGNKLSYFGLAVVLPLLSVKGYVFDLQQGYVRNEFPHWADTLAIPLAAVPIVFAISLVWSLSHLVLLKNTSTRPLSSSVSRQFNPWLALICIVTGLMMLETAYYGQYWYAVPAALWLYYYLSLGLSRLDPLEN